MSMQHAGRSIFAIAAVSVFLTGCGGDGTPAEGANSETVTIQPADMPGAETTGPVTLTAADFDGFVKGITRETELVREASAKSASAATPQERGEAIQAGFEVNTIPAAAPATGLSADRYKLVRETLATILTTLDFQGVIDGPQSVDTARAGAEMKARLSSDPYSALDAASAAEMKSRLDRIAPAWIEYVTLTAVAG